MAMSKKDFVALADSIRVHNQIQWADGKNRAFNPEQLEALAQFCKAQNSSFMWDRWLDYIAGNCGKNGGAVKPRGCEDVQHGEDCIARMASVKCNPCIARLERISRDSRRGK